ncbi:hypothetical protein Q2T42_25920 [Leptolyngbya boryana CZ1]|uniref:Uncharacterized protein n=1 Tax=Leptolyngbya boryana CZ1 TaxID=3060204 RepID=A0AA96WW22_LEPBY|nr:hypothetical protein [Leptolyngbya boryana]WNZ45229.1 hypothetical protein Q2T42_25920 [Leptolyngbya boryana CZ1]
MTITLVMLVIESYQNRESIEESAVKIYGESRLKVKEFVRAAKLHATYGYNFLHLYGWSQVQNRIVCPAQALKGRAIVAEIRESLYLRQIPPPPAQSNNG